MVKDVLIPCHKALPVFSTKGWQSQVLPWCPSHVEIKLRASHGRICWADLWTVFSIWKYQTVFWNQVRYINSFGTCTTKVRNSYAFSVPTEALRLWKCKCERSSQRLWRRRSQVVGLRSNTWSQKNIGRSQGPTVDFLMRLPSFVKRICLKIRCFRYGPLPIHYMGMLLNCNV